MTGKKNTTKLAAPQPKGFSWSETQTGTSVKEDIGTTENLTVDAHSGNDNLRTGTPRGLKAGASEVLMESVTL